MKVDILSLFPEYFSGPFDVSMIKRAIENYILDIGHVNIRDFSKDKHQSVDDRPFGGGPGMVLCAEPVVESIRSVKKEGSHVVYLSPQGKTLNSTMCQRLATKPHLILLCGHYEGIDERAIKKEVHEEVSIGDYVLTNGCLPAIVLLDAVMRFIPGVLGHPDAAYEDSFQNHIFDGPHYTRPDIFEEMAVPEVLKSGNHAEIQSWRRMMGIEKTKSVRPDLHMRHLLETYEKSIKKGEKSCEPQSTY